MHTTCGVNSFLCWLKKYKTRFSEFAFDLHEFFKYSKKKIGDYFSTDFITDLEPQHMIRHSETRWFSLQKVLMRIYEQLQNLKVYFLQTVTKHQSLKGKNGVGANERCLRIKNILTTKKLPAVMSAVIYVSQLFQPYISSQCKQQSQW